ncbi:MAG TPA: hypothetical protein V6C58_28340 [Allocoleopsis sp.]
MGVIEWYLLFAVTTAAAAHYELVSPVFNMLEMINDKHNLIQYRFIASITFFLMNVVIAPIIFLPCVVPKMGVAFREGLLNAFKE